MLSNSFPGPAGVTSSADIRKAMAGLVVRDRTTGAARAGILPRGTGSLVTPSGSGSITVAVGRFNAVTVRGGGALLIANDATALVTFDEAPIANARIDVLWFKQNESDYGDGDDAAVFGITPGTPAAAPDAPTVLEDGAVPLIEIYIPAGAVNASSSGVSITEVFPYTCLEGGTLLVRSTAELDDWAPHDYSVARVLGAAGETYERVGGVWLQAGGVPPGTIVAYAGSAAPTGYLLCDGAAISRATYSRLFTALGTAYGAGNGTTTFNVPNLKGRVAVGRDAGDASFDVLGDTGGEKAHQLTVNEMPSHNHDRASSLTAYYTTANNGTSGFPGPGTPMSMGANTENRGGNQAHNNLQPFVVTNYIIKV